MSFLHALARGNVDVAGSGCSVTLQAAFPVQEPVAKREGACRAPRVSLGETQAQAETDTETHT